MLMTAVILNLIGALGLCFMGVKYCFRPAPVDCHLKILGVPKSELDLQQVIVFSAIYRVMGASFLAVAISIASLSWFGVSANLLWAKVTVLIVGMAVGFPAFAITYRVAKQTDVETPWKPIVIMLTVLIVAFTFSVI
ncbi:MAG: hypothetical protein K9G33_03850 [Sneathiella sp.]|nr:hypothetical protein [Sneathiella sp.]